MCCKRSYNTLPLAENCHNFLWTIFWSIVAYISYFFDVHILYVHGPVWTGYFQCLLQQYGYNGTVTEDVPATSPGSVISPTRAPAVDCDPTYFYHNKHGIVSCTRVCHTEPADRSAAADQFCSINCPGEIIMLKTNVSIMQTMF